MTFTELDPLAGIALLALFVVTAILTMKRASLGLAALLVMAPMPFSWSVLGTDVTLSKVALTGAVVGLSTYTGLPPLLRERAATRVLIALLAVAICTLVSLVPAEYHAPVIRETFKALEHVALVAVAYLAYRLDANDDLLRNVFAFSTGLVICSALLELVTTAHSSLTVYGTVIPRIAGFLAGPNQLGGYLELAIAVLGAWCMRDDRNSDRIALALCAFAMILTFSRGASAGVLVIVAVLLWYQQQPMRAILPILGGAFAGCIGAIAQFAHESARHQVLAASADPTGGVGDRDDLWRAAWMFFRSHPLLGIGAGNFELRVAQAGLPGVRTHANSWYLQTLAEGGLLLFASTIAFIASLLRELQRHLRSAGPWVLGAFAASLALCIHQTVDYLIFFQGVGTPWMLIIGIALAASTISEAPSNSRS